MRIHIIRRGQSRHDINHPERLLCSEVDVPASASLCDAVYRAYAEHGLGKWPGHYVGLYKHGHFRDLVNSMHMIDANGEVLWNVPVRSRRLTVGAVDMLCRLGLSDADLSEPIVVGDELSPEGWFGEADGWAQVLGAVYGILQVGAVVGGVASSLALLWGVLRRSWRRWRSRGAGPGDVLRLVRRRRLWRSRELATLLGIPRETARKLLRSLGYEYDSSLRMFRYSGPPEEQVRRILEKHFTEWELSEL